MKGLYIHIPFCRKKCNYCDFYSIGGKNTVADEYITAVIVARIQSESNKTKTILHPPKSATAPRPYELIVLPK